MKTKSFRPTTRQWPRCGFPVVTPTFETTYYTTDDDVDDVARNEANDAVDEYVAGDD